MINAVKTFLERSQVGHPSILAEAESKAVIVKDDKFYGGNKIACPESGEWHWIDPSTELGRSIKIQVVQRWVKYLRGHAV